MLYAYDQDKNKIEARPAASGFCPGCGTALIPKCGEIKAWHWSHKGRRDCDSWYEPETEWHQGWKRLFGREHCEVVVPPHRADILGNFDVVIQLRRSRLSPKEIAEREEFYKKMIWLVDALPFHESLLFYRNQFYESSAREELSRSRGNSDWLFYNFHPFLLEQKHCKRNWTGAPCRMPVMLDLSQCGARVYNRRPTVLPSQPDDVIHDSLFWVKATYSGGLTSGRFVSKARFLERYRPA
jgi:competence protein CoiA